MCLICLDMSNMHNWHKNGKKFKPLKGKKEKKHIVETYRINGQYKNIHDLASQIQLSSFIFVDAVLNQHHLQSTTFIS